MVVAWHVGRWVREIVPAPVPYIDRCFFFSSRRRHTRCSRDWSSDVCSSDLECRVGIMPTHLFSRGHVGIVSRSGTLTYEIVAGLTRAGLGQSTAVGLGGDPVVGLSFVDVLQLFNADPDTHAIVLIGEIGGAAEEEAARYIGGPRQKTAPPPNPPPAPPAGNGEGAVRGGGLRPPA